MRILFIGDIYGQPGREMAETYVPRLKKLYQPTVTIINGENAAHGKGITEKIYRQLMEAGADMITLGNHSWDNKDIFNFIDDAKNLVRPANFPKGTPGVGLRLINVNQNKLAVINLQGRTFMQPIDDPFTKADELVEEARKHTSSIFVDFHAETTSEKLAMGWYLEGRVSAVVGTHTHVPTADARIFPQGTAYLTDVGMTGPYDGILGVQRDAVIRRFKTQLPVRFEAEEGRTQLCSVIIDINDATGRATAIKQVLVNDDHPLFD